MSTWRKGIAVVACLLVVLIALPAAAKAPAGKTLGIKAADFEARFNEAAGRVKSNIRAQNVEIKQDKAGKILRVNFSPYVNLWGMLDQAGGLSQVVMLYAGGGEEEVSRFTVCAVILVEMCAPGLGQKGCMGLLKETGFFDPNRQKGEHSRDGVKYNFSKELGGVTFGVAGS